MRITEQLTKLQQYLMSNLDARKLLLQAIAEHEAAQALYNDKKRLDSENSVGRKGSFLKRAACYQALNTLIEKELASQENQKEKLIEKIDATKTYPKGQDPKLVEDSVTGNISWYQAKKETLLGQLQEETQAHQDSYADAIVTKLTLAGMSYQLLYLKQTTRACAKQEQLFLVTPIMLGSGASGGVYVILMLCKSQQGGWILHFDKLYKSKCVYHSSDPKENQEEHRYPPNMTPWQVTDELAYSSSIKTDTLLALNEGSRSALRVATQIAAPLYPGATLPNYLRRNPYLSVVDLMDIFFQLSFQIFRFNFHNLLVRDIKPDNIVVYMEGSKRRVLLIDKDSMRPLVIPVHLDDAAQTLDYQAPEQRSITPVQRQRSASRVSYSSLSQVDVADPATMFHTQDENAFVARLIDTFSHSKERVEADAWQKAHNANFHDTLKQEVYALAMVMAECLFGSQIFEGVEKCPQEIARRTIQRVNAWRLDQTLLYTSSWGVFKAFGSFIREVLAKMLAVTPAERIGIIEVLFELDDFYGAHLSDKKPILNDLLRPPPVMSAGEAMALNI